MLLALIEINLEINRKNLSNFVGEFSSGPLYFFFEIRHKHFCFSGVGIQMHILFIGSVVEFRINIPMFIDRYALHLSMRFMKTQTSKLNY